MPGFQDPQCKAWPLALKRATSRDIIDFDVLLFGFSAGLSFQYLVPSSEYAAIDFTRARGRIGMSVLVW